MTQLPIPEQHSNSHSTTMAKQTKGIKKNKGKKTVIFSTNNISVAPSPHNSPSPSPSQQAPPLPTDIPAPNLPTVEYLDEIDTITIPIGVFNDEQLQLFADLNPQRNIDVIDTNGVCN